MSADLDKRIEDMRVEVRVRESASFVARQTLARLEAEREALAYPASLETAPDSEEDRVVVSVAMDSPMASVEVMDRNGNTHLAYVTPADARRMAVWLAAFAEEHGA